MYARKNKWAFTLVELLVVIGIIALLIAILMPALSRARKQALQASCGSNARQVTYGALAYGNDWKEQLPTRFNPDVYDFVGWVSAGLHSVTRLPVIGFDTTTVWDWGTYLTPYSNMLGGFAFVMRDYLKNDFDVYTCPDGWYTRADWIIKWRADDPNGIGCWTGDGNSQCPGLFQSSTGYLWLPHRRVDGRSMAFTPGCAPPGIPPQDTPGDIAKTASDLPSLLILTDMNVFTYRPNADCPGPTGGCGVGANHNSTSYRQLQMAASNCTPQIFPPNIGRQENPLAMPLGMNRARIDARTEWKPWQDWQYYKYFFGWGSYDYWHSF